MGRIEKIVIFIIMGMLVFLCCYPIVFLLTGSLMSPEEVKRNLAPALLGEPGFAKWSFLPMYPTLSSYVEVLLDSPGFFVMFWNSIKITGGILLGQILVSVPAAWGFARFHFRFHKILLFTYIILMMMPFQVTMLSNYFILNKLHLINNIWAIILPGIFSAFPIFIMYNFFRGIPKTLLEAARIDGAGEIQIFFRVGLPLGKPGIISAMVLGFLEYWNLIEQPMTFLKNKDLWPLSLYLPAIEPEKAGAALAASVIALIPAMLVFFGGHDYLEQGIASIGIKE